MASGRQSTEQPSLSSEHKEGESRHRHRHHHHRHSRDHDRCQDPERKRKRSPSPPLPAVLPLGAQALSKHDLAVMKPVFASYLDIQKQIFLEDLPEDEIKGRWKSFMGKWNRGQLAEGWYDPATKRRAIESYEADHAPAPADSRDTRQTAASSGASDLDEDDYGPGLPPSSASRGRAVRPYAPNFSELALRQDQAAEDAEEQRGVLRSERNADRRVQRERLEDIAPRAEPGTKERQLEKKREKADAVREFRDAKSGAGEVQEVGETELLGEEAGAEGFKKMKKEMDRKRTEREQRKLDMLQARMVERDERLQVQRSKEEKTMNDLKRLARERGYA